VPVLLAKARESVRIARVILAHDSPSFACSRAYYAMFYVAEAWLLSIRETYASHRAVIAAFGRDITRAGHAPVRQHRYLIEAFESRQEADYGGIRVLDEEEAERLINWAEEMIRTAEERLSEDPSAT